MRVAALTPLEAQPKQERFFGRTMHDVLHDIPNLKLDAQDMHRSDEITAAGVVTGSFVVLESSEELDAVFGEPMRGVALSKHIVHGELELGQLLHSQRGGRAGVGDAALLEAPSVAILSHLTIFEDLPPCQTDAHALSATRKASTS